MSMKLFSWTNPVTFQGARLLVAESHFGARDQIWWGRRTAGLEVREICALEQTDLVTEFPEPVPSWSDLL